MMPNEVEQFSSFFFDPHHSLLGIQVGNQYHNNLGMNMSKYKQYERQSQFTLFEHGRLSVLIMDLL